MTPWATTNHIVGEQKYWNRQSQSFLPSVSSLGGEIGGMPSGVKVWWLISAFLNPSTFPWWNPEVNSSSELIILLPSCQRSLKFYQKQPRQHESRHKLSLWARMISSQVMFLSTLFPGRPAQWLVVHWSFLTFLGHLKLLCWLCPILLHPLFSTS